MKLVSSVWMPVVAGAVCLFAGAAPAAWFHETFATDPAARGWTSVGDASLFAWDPGQGALAATWDSRRTNSYYCHPVGAVLTRTNDFCLTFTLRLSELTPGIDPDKVVGSFPISVGLVNLDEATGATFWRGTGANTPDLVEFSYFPDPLVPSWQWGPSLTSVLVDSAGTNWTQWVYCTSYDGLELGDLYQVTMIYTAADQTLRTSLTRNGQPFGSFPDGQPGLGFGDFRVDHVAICSYSDAGQWPDFAGSTYARGAVQNIALTPPPVTGLTLRLVSGVPQAQFLSAPFWTYRLERTTDLVTWIALSATTTGTGGWLQLQDPNAPAGPAFYRVRAELP
jgi:hypothetical protein